MCFGDKETGSKTTTSTANPAVSAAATNNLSFVQQLQNAGFTPYTGPQVASFSPQQNASFDMTNNIANSGMGGDARQLIDRYSNAPASSVSAGKISDAMSPYMNQYVMQALAPQLHQQDLTLANNRNATNATATGSGAFGDARTGIEQANNNFNDAIAREGLIGNAYNTAFNTAIGAGAQDVSNNLSAQTTNANLMEQYLGRALGGATGIQNLQNQQLGVAQAENTAGQQRTAQDQANLTAQYNQWLMAQQYPFQTAALNNQTVGAGAAAMPASSTATSYAPDNSGWALAGSLVGALPFAFSDERLKDDIEKVGELTDGQPVYSYHYKADPAKRKHIGLMAQEVLKHRPDAVMQLGDDGPLMVDYSKATAAARLLEMSI